MTRFLAGLFSVLSLSVCGAQSYKGIDLLFETARFGEVKLKCQPVVVNDQFYPAAQYFLGRVAVEEKEYDKAIEYFEKAVEANPKIAEYHNWLGVMYGVIAKRSNPVRQAFLATKIKNEFETAAVLEPGNMQTQWGLLHFYVLAPSFLGGSWDKAMACSRIIGHQNEAQGLRAIAFIHAAQNKKGIAKEELLQALEKDPANAEINFALAEFYEEDGKFDDARKVYEAFTARDPNNMVTVFYFGRFCGEHGSLDQGMRLLRQYLLYQPRPNEPSRSEALYNMAAIYEKKGDKPSARTFYRSSLKLHPGMKEALDGLKRLD